MKIETLGYINSILDDIIPYEFDEWSSELVFPFWVGEFTDTGIENVDGGEGESTFIITGTNDGSMLPLLQGAVDIEKVFPKYGTTAILEDGSGVAISFSNEIPVDAGESGLKRLQINLDIKEWSV